MLTFIFSKTGMIAIFIIVMSSISAYVSYAWNDNISKIELQKSRISSLIDKQKELVSSIDTINRTTKAQSDILKSYNTKVSIFDTKVNALNHKLLESEAKQQSRNMDRLKQSSHAELVLKIINKSISNVTMEFNK